ncbi:hypothetical protein HAX54_023636 [Datura stramonium]|uniref:Uncharacterized protein n=1 Tax=Datura stramonium TaxID=4076 RepID=A0ABS8UZ00_DATST|nr:hypothetical protein [Datura stramonium]
MVVQLRVLENVFAEVINEVDYESAIVPPTVNATSFKIDNSIYSMLKAEGQFHNSTDNEPHQHLKNFLEFEAWERFKQYILRVTNHGLVEHILLKKFYIGLDPLTQSIGDNVIAGCFIDKTFNQIVIILDRIAKHNHAWHEGDQSGGINMGTHHCPT